MLKTTKHVRPNLYHNKYKYRLEVVSGIFDFSDFKSRLQDSDHDLRLMTVRRWSPASYRGKVSTGTVFIYFNDLSFLDSPLLSVVDLRELKEIELTPPDVLYFVKEPPARYRIYLKKFRCRGEKAVETAEAILKNDQLYACSALTERMNRATGRTVTPFFRLRGLYNPPGLTNYLSTSRSDFVDVLDEPTVTYFFMMFPELARKIYRLEKRPKQQP